MDQRIKLLHPAGRKAVSIDKEKYDILRNAVLNSLKKKGESTHSEILEYVTDLFKRDKVEFEGSVEWHLEWVKLDLEARNMIKRVSDKSPIRYSLF
jgi:hypothetical protein